MERENLQATINLTMIIAINVKDVPALIQNEIKKRLILRFNRDEAINLGDEKAL